MPFGEFRYWDLDAFAQDSWKIRPNLTLEFGVRFGKWTNNEELNGEGGYFTPSLYDPTAGSFLDPGTYKLLNGVCYVYNGCAPSGILPNRSAFALPRVNAAWDIDGEGKNVLRGGYGLFYNRNMGNVEYDNALRLPPNAYAVEADFWNSGGIANNTGLTYDTASLITMADRIGSIGINTPTPDSLKWPTTHSFSVSYARRIPWQQVVEVAYVGTRGRNLVSRSNGNVMPYGVLATGTFNGVDLSVPINRVAVASVSDNLASFRPFNALSGITLYDYHGVSDYDSMQVTLSRQTGKRLQYFVAYTLGRTKGTLGGEYSNIDPYDPSRTYGVLSSDRTHVLNVSWNAFLPDGARGALDNPVLRGVLNGWQLSGISTLASGIPITPVFSGDAAAQRDLVRLLRHGRRRRSVEYDRQRIGPGLSVRSTTQRRQCGREDPRSQLHCRARLRHHRCAGAAVQHPDAHAHEPRSDDLQELPDPRRSEDPVPHGLLQPVQPGVCQHEHRQRHQPDVLDTVCNARVDAPDGTGDTQNVCDPTQGFHYTQQTIDNFGKINLKRGHRVIEFVIKYYF